MKKSTQMEREIAYALAQASAPDLSPLSDDEAALLYHVGHWGSDGYPIQRVGRSWHWQNWRGVRGSPVAYRTKRLATQAFEAWIDLARTRWAQMVAAAPGALTLTATGVRRTND